MISASLGVGVVCGLPCARLMVTKVPLIAFDSLSSSSACELCGFALANRGGIETGGGGRVHCDRLCDVVGASAVA